MLQAQGHDVAVAHASKAALERIVSEPPEVCLRDVGLPEMDGYEAKAIADKVGASRIQLVALTGYGQQQDRERALRSGFAEHFTKPVDFDQLAALLAKIGRLS